MAAPLLTEESIREETAIQDTLRNIKHVIIVMSGKGGVGKSTVSSNLAMSLSMKGFKTGVMDIDITGPNIPKMFAVEDRQLMVENEKLIPVAIPPSLKLMSMAFNSAILHKPTMSISCTSGRVFRGIHGMLEIKYCRPMLRPPASPRSDHPAPLSLINKYPIGMGSTRRREPWRPSRSRSRNWRSRSPRPSTTRPQRPT
jgi:hypothetical protein